MATNYKQRTSVNTSYKGRSPLLRETDTFLQDVSGNFLQDINGDFLIVGGNMTTGDTIYSLRTQP